MPEIGINFRYLKLVLALVISLCAVPLADLGAENGTVAVITNRFANIRSGPGTKFTRLGRVYRGDRFPVSDIRPEWIEISYSGRAAWVFGELVRLEQAGLEPEKIERVDIRIDDLNNRLDRLVRKVEQVAEMIDQRYPDPPAVDSTAILTVEPKRKLQPAEFVSPAWVFIPGGPRLSAGDRLRGWGLLGLTAACAGGGYYFHAKHLDYRDDYRALGPSTPAEEFEKLYAKADNRRRVSDALFYAAAGLYALNVLDYFFFLPHTMAGMAVAADHEGGGRINLSMSKEF
ncbi:MAG: SH3 domain-containing protein [Candidatus Glassbacteria bacterium]|nr:SH3 domain-containing protein [Candidatus Glassbacteria bacterium]